MMKKLYDKSELTFALVWIGIYCVGMSIFDEISRYSREFCVSEFRQSQEFGSDDCRVRLNSLVCLGSGGRRGMRASGVNAAAASREQ